MSGGEYTWVDNCIKIDEDFDLKKQIDHKLSTWEECRTYFRTYSETLCQTITKANTKDLRFSHQQS